jgi:DNA polymerase (family 10)
MSGVKTEDIARHLRVLAVLLEFQGESPFRYRAFVTGADALTAAGATLEELLARDGGLEGIKGIGKSLAGVIREFAKDGDSQLRKELMEGVPSGLLDWLEIPGLGVKKARVIAETLRLETVEDLKAALEDGRIASLPGMGEKTAEKLLAGLDQLKRHQGRHLASTALSTVGDIRDQLIKAVPGLKTIETAGSLRRGRETVGDGDLVACTDDPAGLMEIFCTLPGVLQVLGQGATKSSVIMQNGFQVDLRVVPEEEFPTALAHFTGSKEHNVAMRKRALERGLRLNEYGLFQDSLGVGSDAQERRAARVNMAKKKPGKSATDPLQEAARYGERLPIQSESDLYAHLGLQYIPPELREDQGELEVASRQALPPLVTAEDYRGVLHCHTIASDGMNTLEEMVQGSRQRGWQFYGTGDHSQTAAYAGGMKPAALLRQLEEIDRLNEQLIPAGFRILKGVESDILPDGSLDYTDDLLDQLDYVVASIHSKFNMSADEATERMVRAIRNPYTTILGHPSGRLLLKREGYPFHLDVILEEAAATGTYLEINASPMRLDLDWRFLRRGSELGVHFSINPDAHSVGGLDDVRYGLAIARKGWLGPQDILNCQTPDQLLETVRRLRREKMRLSRT